MAWEKETVLCLHHGVDMDGWCGAEVVGVYCAEFGKHHHVRYYGANYEPGMHDIKSIVQEMPNLKFIFIVDYHIPVEDMFWLLEHQYFVRWYDHHASAFLAYARHMEELRSYANFSYCLDGSKSGARIAYDELLADKQLQLEYPHIEEVVGLVSTYDTWDKNHADWAKARCLNHGMMGNVNPPKGLFYLMFKSEDTLQHVLHRGKLFLSKELERYRVLCAANAGVLEWKGLRFITVNGHGNSAIFESFDYPKIFDAGMVWHYSAVTGLWKVSMYGLDCSPENLDMSTIATEYGGGGHAKACGFMVPELPFDIKTIKPLPKD